MKDKFRYIKVIFFKGDKELIYDNYNFDIEFDCEMTRSSSSNVIELNIYNLIKYKKDSTDFTKEFLFFTEKPHIEVHAGYTEEYGIIPETEDLVFRGILVGVTPKDSDLDVSFNFLCMQEIDIWTKQILNVEFPEKKKPSEIVTEVINKFGTVEDIKLEVGKLDFMKDIPYASRFTKSNTTMERIFGDIAKDTFCNYYIENSKVYFVPKIKYIDVTTEIKFSEILKPSNSDLGLEIEIGFRNLKVNTLVLIENIDKRYVIDKIAHKLNGETDKFETKLQLLDLDLLGKNMILEAEKIKKDIEKKLEKQKSKEKTNKKEEEKPKNK